MENKVKKGTIVEGKFPFFLMEIDRGKWTGILHVKNEKVRKEFYIKEGKVGYSKSNLLSETLGRIMLSEGLIKASEHQKALEIMEEKKVKWGEALKEIGYREDISIPLTRQIEKRMADLFRWKEGEYIFVNTLPDITGFPFWAEIDMVYLISKGISIMDEAFFIRMKDMFLEGKYIQGIKDPRVRIPPSVEELFKREFSGREFIKALGKDDEKGMKVLYFYEVVGVIKKKEEKGAEKVARVLDEEKEIYEWLTRKFEFFKNASLFERLNVTGNSSLDEIKKNYYSLAREFHPDRFHTYRSEAVRDLADRIFTLINDAYNVLSDPKKREEYTAYEKTTEFEAGREGKFVDAEIQFQKAEALEKVGKLKEALEFYKWACKLNPKEPEYRAKMGWTMYRIGKREKDMKEAKDGAMHVFKAYSEAPENDTVTYLVASIYRAEGNYKKTIEFLEKTLKINPDHELAKRELILLKRKEGL